MSKIVAVTGFLCALLSAPLGACSPAAPACDGTLVTPSADEFAFIYRPAYELGEILPNEEGKGGFKRLIEYIDSEPDLVRVGNPGEPVCLSKAEEAGYDGFPGGYDNGESTPPLSVQGKALILMAPVRLPNIIVEWADRWPQSTFWYPFPGELQEVVLEVTLATDWTVSPRWLQQVIGIDTDRDSGDEETTKRRRGNARTAFRNLAPGKSIAGFLMTIAESILWADATSKSHTYPPLKESVEGLRLLPMAVGEPTKTWARNAFNDMAVQFGRNVETDKRPVANWRITRVRYGWGGSSHAWDFDKELTDLPL